MLLLLLLLLCLVFLLSWPFRQTELLVLVYIVLAHWNIMPQVLNMDTPAEEQQVTTIF